MIQRLIIIAIVISSIVSCNKSTEPSKGVSLELAKERKSNISNTIYKLVFDIPENKLDAINGELVLECKQNEIKTLVIDFKQSGKHIFGVLVDDKKCDYKFINGHIVIPKDFIKSKQVKVSVKFKAGDGSLNRNNEYLYSLFVPDRASTCFPCFDQPDIKAIYKLKLNIPENWVGVANAPVKKVTMVNGKKSIQFKPTQQLSTYLFSFATGKFSVVKRVVNGREMNMYHRETNKESLKRNIDDIFNLHANSITWLENYTNRNYPFEKFDFVMIPSFQYGGMEHPGAILYRASKCFLDENASMSQKLARANLIAHETAHIWFGDLVTMEWFNDVWLKEVFANFMADKIVNPHFKEVNHNLKFLMAHTPAAFSVDRTEGAHPIIQNLDNMKNAGTLYGSIIYHKSPIAMNQLELTMGENSFKKAVQEYISRYEFGNANWDQLIDIFDKYCEIDLHEWSKIWIKSPYVPVVKYSMNNNSMTLTQHSPLGDNGVWNQMINVSNSGSNYNVNFNKKSVNLDLNDNNSKYHIINSTGIGYVNVELSESDIDYFLKNINTIESEIERAVVWIQLWENTLNGKVDPKRITQTIVNSFGIENNELIINYILSRYKICMLNLLPDAYSKNKSSEYEKIILNKVYNTKSASLAKLYLKTLINSFITSATKNRLLEIFNKNERVGTVALSNKDITELGFELMMHFPEKKNVLMDSLKRRITNRDKLERIDFIKDAVCRTPDKLDSFFNKLKNAKNREHEPWVADALKYLYHRLNIKNSEKYVLPSLELVEEIQATGDIFFPKRWLGMSLKNFNSDRVVNDVNEFLNKKNNYPKKLRLKILQSYDICKRANNIKKIYN